MKKKMDGFEIFAVLFVASIGFALQYHFIMEHPDARHVRTMSLVFPLMLSWVTARTVIENRTRR